VDPMPGRRRTQDAAKPVGGVGEELANRKGVKHRWKQSGEKCDESKCDCINACSGGWRRRRRRLGDGWWWRR
jgi:hypothetical protein